MVNKNVSLGDRYAEISVLVLTVVALLAGWLYKSNVENRSIAFDSNGITARAPQGWLQAQPTGDEILHTTDISSGGFGTTYVKGLSLVPFPPARITAFMLCRLWRLG